jgi:acyl carrier protein
VNQHTETNGSVIDTTQINVRVRDVVSSLAPGGRRDVQSIDRLTDLGFDSLATLELAMALETEFDLLEVPEGETVEMATVGDIETLIGSLVGPPATSA